MTIDERIAHALDRRMPKADAAQAIKQLIRETVEAVKPPRITIDPPEESYNTAIDQLEDNIKELGL